MQKKEFVLLNSVGLRRIYERRLLRAQLVHTRMELEKAQKIREIKIPYSLFDKKKQRKGLSWQINPISVVSDPEGPRKGSFRTEFGANPMSGNTPQQQQIGLSRSASSQTEAGTESKSVTITYRDSVLPDEVYFSSDFQKVKLHSVVNNMNTVVHKFFRNKQTRQNRELLTRWLGSLEGLDGIDAGKLLSHLLDYFTLETFVDRYIFWRGDRVSRVYILADGQVDLFTANRVVTHRSDGLVMNAEVVRFEDVHTTNSAAFAVGEVFLITLTLSDYLKACAIFKSVELIYTSVQNGWRQ